MIQQTLTFNGIPYLVEYYPAEEQAIKTSERFVMLRDYTVDNDFADDIVVCFYPISKYEKAIQYDEDEKDFYQTNLLCYPVDYNDSHYFSDNILDIQEASRLQGLVYSPGKDKDYYILRDKKGDPINVVCDEIRIYKPHNRNALPAVLDVSNILNGIYFHYFCELYENQPISIGPEKEVNGNRYYEYKTFYIPSLEFLFRPGNVYFNENLNLTDITKFNDGSLNENVTNGLVELNSLILPFSIEKACTELNSCEYCNKNKDCPLKDVKDIMIKKYLVNDVLSNEYINSEYNYINAPVVLLMSHYDSLDTVPGTYYSNAGIMPSSVQFEQDQLFILTSTFEFDPNNQSKLSLVTRFRYPKIYKTVQNDDGELVKEQMSLQDAYFFCNKIYNKEEYYNFESYDDDIFLSDFEERFIESMKFNTAGYMIEISTNKAFDGIFYRTSVAFSQENEIDDFAFSLNNIFDDWNEYPEVLFIRTMFIDKYLCKILYGPVKVLTKEFFKYCINDTVSDFRLNSLVNAQQKITSTRKEDMEINADSIFFIDKINCSVKRHDIENTNVILGNMGSGNAVVYKTVFYRIADSQNIKIRQNVTQKIGINLGDYMSKVSAFILKLDGLEFTETERNDEFVIFTIPASMLSSISGYYDIVNENNEYITSGQYTLY